MGESTLLEATEGVYHRLDGDEGMRAYHLRHGIESLRILTAYEDSRVARMVAMVRSHIEGKVVIEIGAGVGLFACKCAELASKVYAIEADPAWSWLFTKYLYKEKPTNLTWIFGRAQDMIGKIKADTVLVVTNSDIQNMIWLGRQLGPRVLWLRSSEATLLPEDEK